MNIEEKNIDSHQEVIKVLAKYRLAFECPHCHKEISEEHFNKGERIFQLISEKVRMMVENEIDSQKILHRRQWLKEIEEDKKYEQFTGFVNLKSEKEEKLKLIEQLQKVIQEKEKKHILELAEKTSFGEIQKLDWVKDLKQKAESYQKEIEKLKLGSQPEIEKLRENIKNLENQLTETKINSERALAKATSADVINELKVVKELKEERDEYKKDNEELKERNRDLIISKNKDSQRKGEDFEKWFFEELVKVFDGWDSVKDISRGQIGSGKRADFLQEVLTDNEPKEIVGRIIYETKNTEKWDNNWVNKLERDMQTHRADFGFIVATCVSDRVIKLAETIDPRKKIYVSDGNSNLFLVIKVVRELLINRYNFLKMSNETDKEQKLNKIEDWTNTKLLGYIMNFEKQIENQEKAVGIIIEKAEKIRKFKDEIYRITINSIILELRNCLT